MIRSEEHQVNLSRRAAATVAGFLVMFAANAVLAVAVIDPVFSDAYREVVGDGATLDMPLLIAGYALVAVAIALVYLHHPRRPQWLVAGSRAGATVGLAVFLGAHLVQAGYTVIDNTAWVASGLLDVTGPVLAGVTVGFVIDRAPGARPPAARVSAELERRRERAPDRAARDIAELEAVARHIDVHLDRVRPRS